MLILGIEKTLILMLSNVLIFLGNNCVVYFFKKAFFIPNDSHFSICYFFGFVLFFCLEIDMDLFRLFLHLAI